MRLLRLRIERFRGIGALDWRPRGQVLCVVGPGDSGKSTILEAIRVVTTSRTSVTFSEADFTGRSVAEGFSVAATFGSIPEGLLHEDKFGRFLGGVDGTGELRDEFSDDDEPTLTVRLVVTADLEASWRVVTAAQPEGKPIGPRDRQVLSVGVIGVDLDEPFTWAARHALARATDEAALTAILDDATVRMRDAASDVDLDAVTVVVDAVRRGATKLGAGPFTDDLEAAVDLARLNASALVLHADRLRASVAGLGTRRVLAIAVELMSVPSGGLVCVDEVEIGLEPHRVRQLVSGLRQLTKADGAAAGGQVIFTSHSPQVIEEVGTEGLCIVRNDAGQVSVTAPAAELIAVVRGNSSALLARKVIVAEGKTEVGLLRASDRVWAAQHDGKPLSHVGVAVVDGTGSDAAARAAELAGLGYPTLLFTDSDVALPEESAAAATAAGVVHVAWPGEMCTEQRVLSDLSWEGAAALFAGLDDLGVPADLAITKMLASAPGVAALTTLGVDRDSIGDTLAALEDVGLSREQIRECFWTAAKQSSKKVRGWFKRVDAGELLGDVVAADPNAQAAPTGRTLTQIEAWCYAP